MTYKVIRRFADTTDRTQDFPNGHEYEVGDIFPRPGFSASDDWCRKLLTGSNTTGSIFIAVSDDDKDNTPGDTPDNPNDEQDTIGDEPGTEDDKTDNPEDEQDTTELPASEPEKPKRKRSTKTKEV